MIGKLCRPSSDAAFYGVWSGSALYAQAVCPIIRVNWVIYGYM